MPGICIVGCGGYANAHARAFSKIRGVRLFFSSRDPKRAAAYAKRYNGTGLAGFQAALCDERVDGVVLCGPHDRHLPDRLAALRAGMSVLLEKPLARSVSEGRRIAAAARRSRGRLMLAENYAYIPHLEGLRKAVRRTGGPSFFQAMNLGRGSPDGWRLSRARMGGGLLIDVGVHYLRLIALLFGRISRVRCVRIERGIPGMGGESEIELDLKTSRGIEGGLFLSWTRDFKPSVDFLRMEGPKASATALLCEGLIDLGLGGSLRLPTGDLHGHLGLAKAFVRCVRGARPEVGAAEGIEDLKVVAAAYASRGRWRAVKK